uniref:Uncharacterized protein n=1 Tax=Arundo donax TaxID=35708 RepID=A0A0A9HFB5_ARUDO
MRALLFKSSVPHAISLLLAYGQLGHMGYAAKVFDGMLDRTVPETCFLTPADEPWAVPLLPPGLCLLCFLSSRECTPPSAVGLAIFGVVGDELVVVPKEEVAAKRSAEEEQRTAIDVHDADITLVVAEAKEVSKEAEQLAKVRVQVCMEVAREAGRALHSGGRVCHAEAGKGHKLKWFIFILVFAKFVILKFIHVAIVNYKTLLSSYFSYTLGNLLLQCGLERGLCKIYSFTCPSIFSD